MTTKPKQLSSPFLGSLHDLPAALAAAMHAPAGPLPKRERTRRALLTAAVQVFSERGIDEGTIHEIAERAGMATATVYNHFDTRGEVVHQVAGWLAETLCVTIASSYDHIRQAAERMSIGNRRYLWLAEQSPGWALLLLNVMDAAPQQMLRILQYPLADLRLGLGQKAFRISSEQAAMDLIKGTVSQGMRSIASGPAIPGHGIAIATSVLRGLGVPFEKAAHVAARPLPGLLEPPESR